MKVEDDDKRVDYLFTIWEGLINYSNANQKTDRNRFSEEIIAALFNLLRDSNYEDLNREGACGGTGKIGFGGVDIGWLNHDAYQITSDSTAEKIRKSLAIFDKNKLTETFPEGIRFLWLSSDKKNNKRRSKIKGNTYFFPEKHIISFTDIANEVKGLKLKDEDRYNVVIEFLVDQFLKNLPELFQLHKSEEKIIAEIKDAVDKFHDRLNEFDLHEIGVGTRIIGVSLISSKLLTYSGGHSNHLEIQRFIRAFRPLLVGFNIGLRKIKLIKTPSEKVDLIEYATADFDQIKEYLNRFNQMLKNYPSIAGGQDVIISTESILGILSSN